MKTVYAWTFITGAALCFWASEAAAEGKGQHWLHQHGTVLLGGCLQADLAQADFDLEDYRAVGYNVLWASAPAERLFDLADQFKRPWFVNQNNGRTESPYAGGIILAVTVGAEEGRMVARIDGDGFRLLVSDGGAVQVQAGSDSYALTSSYSFPSQPIGTNALGDQEPKGEEAWRPKVRQVTPDQVHVTAEGAFYRLTRTVWVQGDRVTIADTLTNRTTEDVGIMIRHRVTASETPVQVLFAGMSQPTMESFPENPTVLVSLKRSRLGIVAEDTVSRLQLRRAARDNGAECSLDHFALRARESRTLRWSFYPLEADADYFTLVNRVRRDWKTNFTIPGPFSFFHLFGSQGEMLRDPSRLKAYLKRKRLQMVALTPWLDYENFNPKTGKRVGREEFKQLMREAQAAFRAAAPDLKCLGSMEGNLVSLPPETTRALFEALPPDQREAGIYPFTEKQMEIIEHVPLRWKDCVLRTPEGRYLYELYYRGPRQEPMMAIAVYAAPGNDQFKYWLEPARFMLEEVGLDGIYMDQFSLVLGAGQRHSYDRWDGLTVDLDPQTGRITRRYTDGAFVCAMAQKQFIEYIRSRGAPIVANTHAAVEEVQSAPVPRFGEMEGSFNPLEMRDGEEPPFRLTMATGHLGSPVGLGYRPGRLGPEGHRNYAHVIMKAVVTYLHAGLLYYHFETEIPEIGEGSGDYGPINHMFPFTPVGLHQGWLEGKERTITCVSGTYAWRNKEKPVVHLFGLDGREKAHDCAVTRSGKGWSVKVGLRDWVEIAVIER